MTLDERLNQITRHGYAKFAFLAAAYMAAVASSIVCPERDWGGAAWAVSMLHAFWHASEVLKVRVAAQLDAAGDCDD